MKKIMKTAISLLMAMLLMATCLMVVSAEEAKDSAEISFEQVATLDPGDINTDTLTNIKDLVRMKKYIANASLGEENPVVINTMEKCDLNEDSAIDSGDLTLLRKLLLGINIFEQIEAE